MTTLLNIDPSNLFVTASTEDINIDKNFVPGDSQMPGDYMDVSSEEAGKFRQIQDQQRVDQAAQYDRDNASGQAHGKDDTNPAQQTAPYGQIVTAKAEKESEGFLTEQAREDITMGVLASLSNENGLVGGRVLVKSASIGEVKGTVIAVGDQEFSVIWEDKTASVERKSDYELVIEA